MFVRMGPYKDHRRRPRQEVVRVHSYDTWSLDYTLAKVIAPAIARLRRDSQVVRSHPSDLETYEQWDDVLAKMQRAFEMVVELDDVEMGVVGPDRERNALIQEGLEMFAKYFRSLWV